MVIPTPPTTPAPVTTLAANMKTRSQGEAESTLMDDFIINRPRKSSAARTKKQGTSHLSRGAKALNRAAAAPGQRRVSNFYYIDPNNVKYEDYLLELEMSDEPPVFCQIQMKMKVQWKCLPLHLTPKCLNIQTCHQLVTNLMMTVLSLILEAPHLIIVLADKNTSKAIPSSR